MIKVLIFLALALFSSAGWAQLNAYWPARESSWIRYQAYRILAYWDPKSRQLSVLQRYPHSDNHFVKIRWIDSPNLARSFNEEFVNRTAAGDVSVLGNMQFELAHIGYSFIGEVGRADAKFLVSPPEPKLPVDPARWHQAQAQRFGTIQMIHQVLDSRSGQCRSWPMMTRFATIGHWNNWAYFTDVWWTSLEEASPEGQTGAVYNYIFARAVGLVDFWYVNEMAFDANSMAWGWEYFASDWMP